MHAAVPGKAAGLRLLRRFGKGVVPGILPAAGAEDFTGRMRFKNEKNDLLYAFLHSDTAL